jgi:hypothetical protein
MPSPTYELFAAAIMARKQITCDYDGYPRELCPHILGHGKNGEEVSLSFQFAGRSSRTLPKAGEWRCLRLAKVSDARLRDGPWHEGAGHSRQQTCVEIIDLDVNPLSPYRPKRRC